MNICPCCGKPKKPPGLDGMGTSLKPAMELIALARKPLSEKTIALNIMRWGTGALNIDATRIEGEPTHGSGVSQSKNHVTDFGHMGTIRIGAPNIINTKGRWPANLLHDGSPEVLAGFPETGLSRKQGTVAGAGGQNGAYSPLPGRERDEGFGDSGSAARFFYSAKADSDSRMASKHPTVKPVNLMQWLVRLITPPGGVTLDPFAGTGTTGEAAWREGFRAVLIEREAEYQADIARRMEYALAGPDARAHAIVKAKGKVEHPGPLFAEDTA